MKQAHLALTGEEHTSTTHKQNFQKALEPINFQLEDIRETYKDPLDGILKYNKQWRCTTFFWEGEWNITLEDISLKEAEIKEDMQKVFSLLIEIKDNVILPKSIKEAYIASLTSMITRLGMFQNALRIEAEKSWFSLSDEDRLQYNDTSLQLLKKIYGERVSDTPLEVESLLFKMHSIFNEKKEHISDEEQRIFQDFLYEFSTRFWYHFDPALKPKSPPKATTLIPSWISINKETLRDISQHIIDLYKQFYKERFNNDALQNREAVLDEGIDSINISGISEQLRIPESYEDVNVQKVIETIASHEIEQHLLHWASNNAFMWKGFSSGGYDFIAEGVAKINEDIATGKINSLEDLKNAKEGVDIGIVWVFICENYNFQDAVQLLKIYKKLTTPWVADPAAEEFARKIVVRRKRFVSYDLPGSSPKDTLYQRGKNRVIDYMTETWDLETAIQRYKDLNIFKLGPKEIHLIQQIKDELNITEDQILYPLFIGRILSNKLSHTKWTVDKDFEKIALNVKGMKGIGTDTKKNLVHILQQLR